MCFSLIISRLIISDYNKCEYEHVQIGFSSDLVYLSGKMRNDQQYVRATTVKYYILEI